MFIDVLVLSRHVSPSAAMHHLFLFFTPLHDAGYDLADIETGLINHFKNSFSLFFVYNSEAKHKVPASF